MLATDIKHYKASVVTDTSANGGRVSINEYVTSGDGMVTILPDITPAERLAGITRMRKVFIRNMNSAGEVLYNPKMFLKNPSPSGDIIALKKATATDTQGTNAATRYYGTCTVTGGSITAGATTIGITLERSDHNPFVNGDTICLMQLNTDTLAIVDYEFHNNITVTASGTSGTITLETGDQIMKNYSGTVTVASVVVNDRALKTEYNNPLVTSAAGTYAFSEANLYGDNIGTDDDIITLTFTSASAFNASSNLFGSLGAGNITSDFAPVHPTFSRPRFTLKKNGFGGVFASGDTISFEMKAASFAVFFVNIVPAGISSYKGNKVGFVTTGDTM